jgi:hypothetical protein
MSSAEPTGCCAARGRWTVSECFDRGLRRRRQPWPATRGAPVERGGLSCRFGVELEAGRVRRVAFACTTCVTLVAYAEAIAERVTGAPLDEAAALATAEVRSLLSGVPVMRQDRAALALAAWRAAASAALCPTTTEESHP